PESQVVPSRCRRRATPAGSPRAYPPANPAPPPRARARTAALAALKRAPAARRLARSRLRLAARAALRRPGVPPARARDREAHRTRTPKGREHVVLLPGRAPPTARRAARGRRSGPPR